VRGSEIKVNINPMSAVKPMRLSFKHIIDPSTAGGDNTSVSGGSPFKRRLNDFYTNASKGFGVFEDIFLSASPDKTRRNHIGATTSPLRHHMYQQHQPLAQSSQPDLNDDQEEDRETEEGQFDF